MREHGGQYRGLESRRLGRVAQPANQHLPETKGQGGHDVIGSDHIAGGPPALDFRHHRFHIVLGPRIQLVPRGQKRRGRRVDRQRRV